MILGLLSLWMLSTANKMLSFHKKKMSQAREALGIYERLGKMVECAAYLKKLGWSLLSDRQFDAAGEATINSI